MDKKILFGILVFILTSSIIANAVAAPVSASTADSTEDVIFNQYGNDSSYSITTVKRDNVDIVSLSFDYNGQSGICVMSLEFKGVPTVGESFFYSGSFVLQAENDSSFSVAVYYSNFVGQNSDADHNQTLVSLSYFSSSLPSIEVQPIVTHIHDKSVEWNIDMANYTSIFSSEHFKIAGLYGVSGEEVNPSSANPDYYIDQINTGDNGTSGTDNLTDTSISPVGSIPLFISSLTVVAIISRKKYHN